MENVKQPYLNTAKQLSRILLIAGVIWLADSIMGLIITLSLGSFFMETVRIFCFCLPPFLALRKQPFPHWKAVTPLAMLLFFSFIDYVYPQIAGKYFGWFQSLLFILFAAACTAGHKLIVNGYSKKWAITASISGGAVLLYFTWNAIRSLIRFPRIFANLPRLLEHQPISGITSLLSPIVSLIMPMYLVICLLLVIARLKKEMDLNDSKPKDTNNNDSDPMAVSILMIILALCWAVLVAMFGGWLNTPLFGDSNHGGTCQFDGCSSKAVGPTYEFCSYHKKALNDYWDVQYQQENY